MKQLLKYLKSNENILQRVLMDLSGYSDLEAYILGVCRARLKKKIPFIFIQHIY